MSFLNGIIWTAVLAVVCLIFAAVLSVLGSLVPVVLFVGAAITFAILSLRT